jgi:hypothetical protein
MTPEWLDQFGVPVPDEEALAGLLEAAWEAPFAEVWLRAGDDGPSLCMLSNGELACLLWQRDPADDGRRSHNPTGDPATAVQFQTADGNAAEYPGHWAVPKEEAFHAVVHFFRTGTLSDRVTWSDQP